MRILLILCLLVPAAANADSDGFFCASEKFVALESRSFNSDGVHRVKIIPLSEKGGIGAESSVTIPDFQVHAMSCTADEIRLLSWSDEYRLDSYDSRALQYAGSSPCPDCPQRFKGETPNNVRTARDQIVPVESESGFLEPNGRPADPGWEVCEANGTRGVVRNGRERRAAAVLAKPKKRRLDTLFKLVFARNADLFPGSVEHTTIVKIVQESGGTYHDSRIIYAETRYESVH